MYTREYDGVYHTTPVGMMGYTLLHPWVLRAIPRYTPVSPERLSPPVYTRGYEAHRALLPWWVYEAHRALPTMVGGILPGIHPYLPPMVYTVLPGTPRMYVIPATVPAPGPVRWEEALGSDQEKPVGGRPFSTSEPQECDGRAGSLRRVVPLFP